MAKGFCNSLKKRYAGSGEMFRARYTIVYLHNTNATQ